ncbi:flagellar motor protein MotP [Halalkalibacter hemicellulosilyticus]|uniref:Flagellar motor rotation protein MotA n=1 Tax=Halalkalibacter hemicellulosilyticusJCM 9152 TaxID=1236971 RepID=W4QL85_9BACI|nr:flagellar motor protein MotP [Halalkalibacter hemicellulosilyticus]GAE32398.1 flagellar motor rotation protein MotA [Halalkalibacter hemicellulosilyticusJCM 9152]
MKKFDLMTVIGIFLGISVLLLAIFNNAGAGGVVFFIQIASILIVGGGTTAAIIISFSLQELKVMPKVLKESFQSHNHDLNDLIDTFVDLSGKARREGLLSLEASADEVEDPFIRKGVLLAVDGIEPDVIKDIMMAEVVAMEERHRKGRALLEKAGEFAPTWGMIGTVIGLVLMLQNLDDPSTLGPNMAVALLTTLYGIVLANLVFIPMANKLNNKTDEEVFVKQIIIEGVIGVQSGQNPKILKEKLSAFISEKDKKEETGEENVES